MKEYIFDLDGTLWNAASTTTEAWNSYFNSIWYERNITSQEIESVTGKTIEECVRILFPGVEEQFPQRDIIAELWKSEEELLKEKGWILYSGVWEGLQELKRRKIPIFIVSNCQEWYLHLFLKQFSFWELFDDFDCHWKSGISKMQMIKNMVRQNNLQSPIYVGDTQWDYEAAMWAGVDFIHALYWFWKIDVKTRVIQKFSELMEDF